MFSYVVEQKGGGGIFTHSPYLFWCTKLALEDDSIYALVITLPHHFLRFSLKYILIWLMEGITGESVVPLRWDSRDKPLVRKLIDVKFESENFQIKNLFIVIMVNVLCWFIAWSISSISLFLLNKWMSTSQRVWLLCFLFHGWKRMENEFLKGMEIFLKFYFF